MTKPEFLEEVRKKGEYFREKLVQIDEVEGVDGLGLMIGVRLKTKKAANVLNKCFEKRTSYSHSKGQAEIFATAEYLI